MIVSASGPARIPACGLARGAGRRCPLRRRRSAARTPPRQKVALVAIEFAARRRFRVNGLLAGAGDGGLAVEVEQAYGNCPQYIRPRALDTGTFGGPAATARTGTALTAQVASLVSAADTFFLGTTHPERRSDASYRGGPPGFVSVLGDGRLRWADLPGNNLFNSLGNLAVDPGAALLFLAFGTGATLQLSGTAAVEWDTAQPEPGTGRGSVRWSRRATRCSR